MADNSEDGSILLIWEQYGWLALITVTAHCDSFQSAESVTFRLWSWGLLRYECRCVQEARGLLIERARDSDEYGAQNSMAEDY